MNEILCLALGFLAAVALYHSQCTRDPPKTDPDTGELVPGCRDDEGVLRPFGSTRNSKDCYKCSCNSTGLNCCNLIPIYFGLLKFCKLVVNKDCTYKLMNKKGA